MMSYINLYEQKTLSILGTRELNLRYSDRRGHRRCHVLKFCSHYVSTHSLTSLRTLSQKL